MKGEVKQRHPSEARHLHGAIGRARRLRREMTEAEQRLWSALRAQKMNFRRQVPIGRFIVDFAQHEHRIVIELDGGHHNEPDRLHYDVRRTEWLTSRGYQVLRFWNHEVIADRAAVIDAILAAIVPSPFTGEG